MHFLRKFLHNRLRMQRWSM